MPPAGEKYHDLARCYGRGSGAQVAVLVAELAVPWAQLVVLWAQLAVLAVAFASGGVTNCGDAFTNRSPPLQR